MSDRRDDAKGTHVPPPDALTEEFDELFARMQRPSGRGRRAASET